MIRACKKLLFLFFLCVTVHLHGQDPFDGGIAISHTVGDAHTLSNRAIEAKWNIDKSHFESLSLLDRLHQRSLSIPSLFGILFADGRIIRAQELHFIAPPAIQTLKADAVASRFSDRVSGKEFTGVLEDENGDIRVEISLVLRDGSSYLREMITISAPHQDLAMSDVRMIDLQLPEAQISGTVAGSPIVDGNFFLGFEHPLASSSKVGDEIIADLKRTLPLRKGQSITYSSVIGVAPPGQMRRAFLTYIERERAHPYRTFLHYNTWYDLGYFTPYDQAGAIDRINTFGRELHEKRGVTLDSVLFDDGWDNHASLWKFNPGFPNGFATIREATNRYGFASGVWMSPWGGYSKPKQERIQFGRSSRFEIVDGGYALSGPKYYDSFRDVCLEMIRKYGVNQFKFDGTGNADRVFHGSRFDSDFDAMIHLIGELRHEKPDIYINLTTGTTASPFWLLYADSIWRGGEDQELAGIGNNRERWITYRDADTYAHIVSRGGLYPLNSLMLHGIIYARYDDQLNTDPGNDFANEVRSYFGSGTQLQEMYITPSLLSTQNWDTLAEAANWSRTNASVLKDTHWVGGDPAWLKVYGWASWTPQKGILVLRNPSDKPQSITINLAKALELPERAARSYSASSPWKADAENLRIDLNASTPHEFKLAPFEVETLELIPK
ncbi:MAG TPA: enterotoxin [Edaphobacter sp.]|nr:enterotoxin [Edaphobacter sp.]